jgi:hypothetical protein
MEDLAGRILQYKQQPGSSSSHRMSELAIVARVFTGQLPRWQDFAFGLLRLWGFMPMLHFQCMLAGSPTNADNQGASSSSSRGATSQTGTAGSSTGSSSGSSSKGPADRAASKGGTPWKWAVMSAGDEDMHSALSLQVQAAWLRPNLLRLQHAWLHHIQAEQVSTAINMQNVPSTWAQVQRAPSLHPAVVQLGESGPAVAAAVSQLGSRRLEELQVRGGGRWCGVLQVHATKVMHSSVSCTSRQLGWAMMLG